MHSDLGTLEWGGMRSNAAELAAAVAAFFTDLGDQADKVTLVALSEFGRRVAQNANYGLDHGYGNVMFVAGAGVKGGRYYGTLPPLTGDVTPTYRSRPTTAACSQRWSPPGSAPRAPPCSPASSRSRWAS